MPPPVTPESDPAGSPRAAAELLRAALKILDTDGATMVAVHVSMALGVMGEPETEDGDLVACVG